MTTEMDQARNGHPKSEKISALTALIGPETMERLRRRHPGFGASPDESAMTDAERVAWQRNRLLERLRSNWDGPPPAEKDRSKAAPGGPDRDAARSSSNSVDRVDRHIASGLSLTNLKDEHPAVIARVLRGLDRAGRVSVLQQLPGHTARAALRRLKSP
jgi:hypothetical protein